MTVAEPSRPMRADRAPVLTTASREELGLIFSKAAAASGVIGAQLSVIRGREHIDLAYGHSHYGHRSRARVSTSFQIGSTTKLINALVLFSLVDEGRLTLDEPVAAYLPSFRTSDRAATGRITLRHLLSMSSGLDNGDYADHGDDAGALERRVASLEGIPQHFEPGRHFGYSNAGTDIAGRIAERVSGSSWAALARSRVTDPLGLASAVPNPEFHDKYDVAYGHQRSVGSGGVSIVAPWCVAQGSAPAGTTFAMSAQDLARLGRLFLDRGRAADGARLLSETAIEQMMSPQIDVPLHYHARKWGMGPMMNQWSGHNVWGHHGGNVSGASFLHWVPSLDAVIACTSNTSDLVTMGRLERAVLEGIAARAFGIGKSAISREVAEMKVDHHRYTGTYHCLAGTSEVRSEGSRLTLRTQWKLIGAMSSFCDVVKLTPLGDGRFLIDTDDADDPSAFPRDIAFGAESPDGRATTLLRSLFVSSRS